MKLLKPVLAASAVALLSACNSSDDKVTFKPIEKIFGENTEDYAGDESLLTSDVGDGNTRTAEWNEDGVENFVQGDGQLGLGFNDRRRVDRLEISSGSIPVAAFNVASGDTIADDGSYIRATSYYSNGDTNEIARIADPRHFGFEYQTYGVWITGFDSTSGTAGVGSFGGDMTPLGADTPVNGKATYKGGTTGLYQDGLGEKFFVAANLKADANFLDNTMEFATTSTEGRNLDTDARKSLNELNLTGDLAIVGNTFVGRVESLAMTGEADGAFYGDEYQEMGGTFGLSGAEDREFIGSFGGRR